MKSKGLKTCVYSGSDDRSDFEYVLDLLDYLKIGHFDEAAGSLESQTTNQRFYRLECGRLIDITSLFREGRLNNGSGDV